MQVSIRARSMTWFRPMGLGSEIFKSEVSRICAERDRDPEGFRNQPLGHVEFPWLGCLAPVEYKATIRERRPLRRHYQAVRRTGPPRASRLRYPFARSGSAPFLSRRHDRWREKSIFEMKRAI